MANLTNDASLDTTGGWWEVRLYTDGVLVRRRHVPDLKVAEGMIVKWLGCPEWLWDAAYAEVGIAPWNRSV